MPSSARSTHAQDGMVDVGKKGCGRKYGKHASFGVDDTSKADFFRIKHAKYGGMMRLPRLHHTPPRAEWSMSAARVVGIQATPQGRHDEEGVEQVENKVCGHGNRSTKLSSKVARRKGKKSQGLTVPHKGLRFTSALLENYLYAFESPARTRSSSRL